MTINWYTLKFLFDDSIIQQLKKTSEKYHQLVIKNTLLKEENKEINEDIKILSEENKEIKKRLEYVPPGQNYSEVIIDGNNFEQTPITQNNKPSAHSLIPYHKAFRLAYEFGKEVAPIIGRRNYRFAVLNTNSMEPLIDANSVVVANEITGSDELKNGDIVIYEGKGSNWMPDGALVIHRITDYNPETRRYKIRGDNNFRSDGWILRKWIKYQVHTIIYTELTEEKPEGD